MCTTTAQNGSGRFAHLAEDTLVAQIRQVLVEFLVRDSPDRRQFLAGVQTFLAGSKAIWERTDSFGVTDIDLRNLKLQHGDMPLQISPWNAKELTDQLLRQFGTDKAFFLALERCLPAGDTQAQLLSQLSRLHRATLPVPCQANSILP